MIEKKWALAVHRRLPGLWTGVALVLGAFAWGCQSGGVGDPCTPEDEYQQFFSGYAFTEVNIESRSFQCETRLCLVNHFQGRVSCPYGQTAMQAMAAPSATEYQLCHIPGTTRAEERIKVAVEKTLVDRQAEKAVYCSCRCDGPDPNARYCKCPTGFQCVLLVNPNDRLGAAELAGSYCIKNETEFTLGRVNTAQVCQPTADNFPGGAKRPPDPAGDCGAYDGQ
jgi:hypothetical protein